MRVELPDDGWAILCSPRKVQERKRRRFVAALGDLANVAAVLPQIPNPRFGQPGEPPTVSGTSQMPGKVMEATDLAGDMLILCLVKEWSFGPEISEAAIQDLDSETFDALFKACNALRDEVLPDYSPDPSDDPKVLTPGPPPSATGSLPDEPTTEIRLSAVTS